MSAADYGWFSPADLQRVTRALARDPERQAATVLVGGQALVAWILHFDIPMPDTEAPALTQDVDFLGSASDARYLAGQIGATVKVARLWDYTPNTAVVTFPSQADGKTLIVDYLGHVVGLDEKEIRKLAVPLEFASVGAINVLHPILCLKSRFENLLHLEVKRNGNGKTQALIAIDVAAAYISQLLATGDIRGALNAVKKLRGLALSRAGMFCHFEYGFDPLTAVDPERFDCPNFVDNGWPRLLEEVHSKRARRQQHLERRSTPKPRN